jgi:hypothetical protein
MLILQGAFLAYGQQTATVIYSQSFPKSDPSHYVISISTDGHASYEGNGRLVFLSGSQTDDSEPDSARVEFTASPALMEKTFALAKQAKYFQDAVDSGNRKLAFTGEKTLAYKDGKLDAHATYNYSLVPAVQELTRLFQGLSSTLEFGRRLEYAHRHQKLALDDETKRLETAANSGSVVELSAIATTLQRIVDDHSVLNIARARAQRLLDLPAAK